MRCETRLSKMTTERPSILLLIGKKNLFKDLENQYLSYRLLKIIKNKYLLENMYELY
jgi:hypothetical protein